MKNGPKLQELAVKNQRLQQIDGKVQPQAIQAEKALLGTILMHPEAFQIVEGLVLSDDFYLEAHRTIFSTMEKMAKKRKNIDLVTLVQALSDSGELESVGGPFALTTLSNEVTGTRSVEEYAQLVKEKSILRGIIRKSFELIELAFSSEVDTFELLEYAEKSFLEISIHGDTGELTPMETVMKDSIEKIEEWRKMEGNITGIPSGYPRLDRATRGWQPGDLIILGARPSVGKTAFALNLIREAASNHIKPVRVAVWSLEMRAAYLGLRLISAASETNLYSLQTGNLTDEEMKGLTQVAGKLADLPVFFDDSTNVTISSLKRKARRMKRKGGLGLIMIDYLQLMEGENKKGNREREVADISRELKRLALELDIPIIALSQLSRESGAKNVIWEIGPPVSALRESGGIEQDADLIMMQWGPSDEEVARDPQLKERRKVRIAKQRNGILITQELIFKSDIQQFIPYIEGSEMPSLGDGNWKRLNDVTPDIFTASKNDFNEDTPF